MFKITYSGMQRDNDEIRENILQILYDKYWNTRLGGYTFKKLQTRLDMNKRVLKGNLEYLENKNLIHLPEAGLYRMMNYYRITEVGIDYIEKETTNSPISKLNGNPKKTLFICYSHDDIDFVNRLFKDLKQFGTNIWIDSREIQLGDTLLNVISDAIQKTEFFAIVLSPSSIESGWVKKELEMAMNQEIQGKKIKVLPILYKKCKVPIYLKDKYYADFTNSDEYINSLVKILKKTGYRIS